MNILALETSMGAYSAAVLCAGSARASGDAAPKLFARLERMERGHAEALLPMAASVMAEAGLDFAALDLIAASTGPGSFTGVRIAIAAARGFALATGAKLFGADSLTVMARAARERGLSGAPLAIAADARRGMLYLGLYGEAGQRLTGPLLLSPEEAAALLPAGLRHAAGSGATLLAEAAARRGQQVEAALPDLQPDAASLAAIALERGETTGILRPLYLRPPDAKPQAQQVARR
ncbi:MAG TPA: tRNA (adenosine(37)-N6)-threonylcarbamoyltransferase complex dimerization subunit type 1 TsaB [Methyloceanibacter sp.]|nr:tRNA (adenosine(37)-N6)-threonylcarbamoyltransferase complex dimerization subunit type 1 TsaB [Methyloceanibacter sp.]